MSMNKIQFQKGLSLERFLELYGTEAQCEGEVVKMRWPNGYECPRCKGKRAALTHNGRSLWECLGCGYQCSSIVGTIMESTKLPLRKWFLSMYLMTQSKNAISALELKRQIGVCYKTAWMMKHKLLEVMAQCESTRRLENRVELDDAYLGGERTGGKVGRGSENKIPFVAAVETKNGVPIFARFDLVKTFSKKELEGWASKALATSAVIVSDGLKAFGGVTAINGVTHESHKAEKGKKGASHPHFRWVNTLLGNLKTSMTGTLHAFKFEKYGRRYLAEFQFRFNRRTNLPAMIRQLLYSAVVTKPQPLHILRPSEDCR